MEHATPYRDAALQYWEAGWHGVLPIPPHSKRLTLRGWTGHDGAWPSYADIQAWMQGPEGDGNIALRLPPGIIGLDVDDYKGKDGGKTLAALIERAGVPLPVTWKSSARPGGVSGIYLFRVPLELAWPGQAGPHIEIIQYGHRYLVVRPSWNPDADAMYGWQPPGGDLTTAGGKIPRPDELPWLPPAWVELLSSGIYTAQHKLPALANDTIDTWLVKTSFEGTCRSVRHAVTQCAVRLRHGSRHEALNAAVLAIVRLGEQGHRGMVPALSEVRAEFLTVIGTERSESDAAGEWRRALGGAVALVLGEPSRPAGWPLLPCRCDVDLAEDLAPPQGNPPGRFGAVPDLPLPSVQRGPGDASTWPQPPPEDEARATDADPAPPQRQGAGAASLAAGVGPDPERPAQGTRPVEASASLVLDEPLANTPLVTDLDVAVRRLRISREARQLLDAEDASKGFERPPFTAHLREELETPDSPVRYQIADIMPSGSNVLLTAGFKTGKTTLINNVAKALADSEPLLGRFEIAWRTGRVGLCNYEVGRDMYRRWLRDVRIGHPEGVVALTLRGYRMPLIAPIVQDFYVDWLAKHEITFWIVDPFARAFVGSGEENSNDDVGVFLDTLDNIKQRAGCPDLILTTHTGRMEMAAGAERSRGATRLDDWADVRWLLTKDERDTRYFRATGRDVDYSETELRYDEPTRALFLGTQSRRGHKFETLVSAITQTVRQNPGIGTRALREEVRVLSDGFSQVEFDEAKRHLRTTNKLIVTDAGNRTTHTLAATGGFADGPD